MALNIRIRALGPPKKHNWCWFRDSGVAKTDIKNCFKTARWPIDLRRISFR